MAVGERIRFFRNRKGMTQKYLGIQVGYPEKSADVRIAQYESGSRGPKEDTIKKIAEVLDVSVQALKVPDIDSYTGLMHTLFALEDLYGIRIAKANGELCLRLNDGMDPNFAVMFQMFSAWQDKSEKLKKGKITKDEYDRWRYQYAKEHGVR